MKSKSSCPVCSKKNIRMFWPRCWNSDDIKVYRCSCCEAIFLHPMMDDASSGLYYSNYAKHLASRGVAPSETPEQTYLRRKKGTSYRFDIVKGFLKKNHSVLEIGGGCGNFIGEVFRSGCISRAVLAESCTAHLEFARKKFGIDCVSSADELSGRKFDRIFLFHTLEHINEPSSFLKAIRLLLKNNGLVIIEVPCSADPLLSIYDCPAYKDFYFQPMHSLVYSENSLKTLFHRNGFTPSRFIHLQRYPLSNHLSWLSKGNNTASPLIRDIISPDMEKSYKRNLERNKMTDTIFGIFKLNHE